MGCALIVEDNILLNRLLEEMVRDLGFSVTTVATLEDARRAMQAGPFDFLLTDLNLGHLPCGLALAQEAVEHSRATRVLLTSGHPAPADIGADIGFLPKPFTVAQLIAAMVRH